ncbi:S41 family peptidase [Commensalibacter sp. Nvir]|uniref:S41 family peptidase n=1 Tax=Commensalibacter sp. Nvir TaxID=3069817 RepID=UPI0030C8352C
MFTLFFLAASSIRAFSQPLTSTTSVNTFNKETYYNVLTTALTFLQPRSLEEHTIQRLCMWGLNGINALDPSFTLKVAENKLYLFRAQKLIYSAELPSSKNDIQQWVQFILDFWFQAWNNSPDIKTGDNQNLIQAFFDELFDHLDPYSRYVAPASADSDRSFRDGGEANVGITLTKHGKYTLINTINTNSPAWEAGIDVGQYLFKVDDKTTFDQPLNTINHWLEGPENTYVILTWGHKNSKKTHTAKIKRELIPPATVFAFSSDDIVILKITLFSTTTAEEMSQYLDQAMQEINIKGLIIDLRGNRGGVLQQAVTSIALLLDNGIAVTTQGRNPEANHVWVVQGGDLIKGAPIVILVDGRTASAAEILAASLSDHRRAVVVGSVTLGKGLVQTIAQLPDNGELFVTWSRVIAPLGWPLQGLGVIPQICTSRGNAFVQKQLKNLGTHTSNYETIISLSRKTRLPLSSKTITLLRNSCPAAVGTDNDLDIAIKLILDQNLYTQALKLIPAE